MATFSASSKNPFRSNAPPPNVTGASGAQANSTAPGQSTTSPPPTLSASVTAPQAQTPPPRLAADDFAVEEPPPYTARPSPMAGETIIEQGPRRPFQPVPSPQQPQVAPTPTGSSYFSSPGPPSSPGRSGGLLQHLSNSLNNVVDIINANTSQGTMSGRYAPGAQQQHPGWSGYPGRQTQPPTPYAPPAHPPPSSSSLRVAPPPRHPSSPARSVSPSASSEFARDFYAAGAAEPAAQPGYAPPPGPPPPPPRPPPGPLGHSTPTPSAPSEFARDFYAAGPSEPPIPDDGRPTTSPVVGHPLLKDGKILVYPKRHECDKCHNVGYKGSDPQRPCKKCWNRYAKPYAGPIAYSFANTTPDANFQRPLPSLPPPRPPATPFAAPQPHFAAAPRGGGGFYSPPASVHPMGFGRPPPGAVVYTAGDPRIGGRLCWRCEGRGSTSFLILDRITCEMCGGIGRTFD
ncbi:hypothetical protein BJ912DRAFT_277214 [Pholiota molesta]|nr:hypothetical protein BJ912DRAFT_277214 [Pholiota molesta]